MSIAFGIWQAGAEMAAWLDRGVLFTDLAKELTGEEITARVISRSPRSPLTAAEHRHLETWRDGLMAGSRREAWLMTSSGRKIARVSSVYLPGRIPDRSVTDALACTDVPLGRALYALGVLRDPLGAETLRGTDYVLRSSGRLLLPGPDGLPVALAEEMVLRESASGS